MASRTSTDLLDHEGPWTEEEFLALPPDNRRIELLDGGLLVSPLAASRHARKSSRLWSMMDAAASEGFEVLPPVNVRHAGCDRPLPTVGAIRRGQGGSSPMLTAEQNDELTQVEAGTPMGDVVRRYWYPSRCRESRVAARAVLPGADPGRLPAPA